MREGKRCLVDVLWELHNNEDLSMDEAWEFAELILSTNARRLYKLVPKSEAPVSSLNKACTLTALQTTNKITVVIELIERGFDYVRIIWIDNAIHRRGKVVPLKLLMEENNLVFGFGCAAANHASPVMFDGPCQGSGLTPTGEVRLIPDLTTLMPSPYFENMCSAMGDMFTVSQTINSPFLSELTVTSSTVPLAVERAKQLQPWEQCARSFLKSQVEFLEKEFGLRIVAGFENEFFLLRSCPSSSASLGSHHIDSSVYCATQAICESSAVLQTINKHIKDQGGHAQLSMVREWPQPATLT